MKHNNNSYYCRTTAPITTATPRNIKIDSAILYYNYGVACRRIYQQQQHQQQNKLNTDDSSSSMFYCDEDEEDIQLLNESMKLFRGAYHMICDQINDFYNRISTKGISSIYNTNNCVELSNDIRLVMLGKLITMNLCTLSYDMCMIDIGDEYYNKHKPISDLLILLYNEWKKLPSIGNNAAAAA